MVTSWILNSVNCEVTDSLLYIDSTAEIWNNLREKFHQSNTPRIFQIQRHLLALNQGSLDVNTYYTRLKILWDELKEFQPIPVYHYGGMKTWMDFQQQQYAMKFLMGLNDSYAQTRTGNLMMDSLPSLSKVFTLVVQEERQRAVNLGLSPSMEPLTLVASNLPLANATKTNFLPQPKSLERPLCSHYGLQGWYTIEKCYKLHGYPPGYKPKSKTS